MSSSRCTSVGRYVCALGLALACAPSRSAWDEPSTAAANRPPAAASPSPGDSARAESDEQLAQGGAAHEARATTSEERAAPRAGFYPLEVAGFQPALVWDPGDSREPLPVWVVAHGAGGDPEWHCQYWQRVFEDSAFLLCLRGNPIRKGSDQYYFPEHFTLGRLLDAATLAFDARYSGRFTSEHNGYIGYSQGATMGALMLPERAPRYPLVLLAEGGYDQWTLSRVGSFAKQGGKAVFFACGTDGCRKGAERSLRHFAARDLPARLGYAAGAGHTPAGEVGELSVTGLGWLVEQAGAR